MSDFGTTIRRLRKQKRLTQKELSDMLGIKQTTYSDWESGKTEPKINVLVRFAELYHTTTDKLLGVDFFRTEGTIDSFANVDLTNLSNFSIEQMYSLKKSILIDLLRNGVEKTEELKDSLIEKNSLEKNDVDILNKIFKEVQAKYEYVEDSF
jgi:transcriptional regulator with XRE-family HTH domain